MDFCNQKCCFGEIKCTSFGINPINIVGTHKVCNFHLSSISSLSMLQCSYCNSICKITLDYLQDRTCSTCQIKNPHSCELILTCGHFHCESCIRTCEKKNPSPTPYNSVPYQEVHLKSINSTSSSNFSDLYEANPPNTIKRYNSETTNFHSNPTQKLRVCPNCGDKLQERTLNCGHLGCLGCYNLKPCIFCQAEEKQNTIITACLNCNKTLKEFRFICGHYGCEGCSFELECRNCKKQKNKRCENCGGLDEPIPLECEHIGCVKCCQKPCNTCFQQLNYKQNLRMGNQRYNHHCQSCSQLKKLFRSYCGHLLCDECVKVNKCEICLKMKCSNCMQRFPHHEYKSCKHKLCYDCIKRISKCKLCFKRCKCCDKLLEISSFKNDTNYCEDCLKSLLEISPSCELCHYDRISFEHRVQGKRICGQCEQYAMSLNKGIPGSALCQYCGEVSETKMFTCNHECCIRCFKNKGCFDCIEQNKVKQYEDPRNGRKLCAGCEKPVNKVVNLLCNHSLCKDCFKKYYLHLDYRCKNCIYSQEWIRCIHCRKHGVWSVDKNVIIKSCCFMKVCMNCSELVIDHNHKCKESGSLSSCVIF